jgi:hypothetical protein
MDFLQTLTAGKWLTVVFLTLAASLIGAVMRGAF